MPDCSYTYSCSKLSKIALLFVCRDATKTRVNKHRRFVDATCQELYECYQKDCTEAGWLPLSFSSFCSLRPPWVKRISAHHRHTCLCMICANMQLLVEALRACKHCLNLASDSDTDMPDADDYVPDSDSDVEEAEQGELTTSSYRVWKIQICCLRALTRAAVQYTIVFIAIGAAYATECVSDCM
jgi:hypothetical protein